MMSTVSLRPKHVRTNHQLCDPELNQQLIWWDQQTNGKHNKHHFDLPWLITTSYTVTKSLRPMKFCWLLWRHWLKKMGTLKLKPPFGLGLGLERNPMPPLQRCLLSTWIPWLIKKLDVMCTLVSLLTTGTTALLKQRLFEHFLLTNEVVLPATSNCNERASS